MGLRNTFYGLAAGAFLLLVGSATPQEAAAQCCAPPPPPCCTPPSPPPCCTPPSPPPRPPSPPSCCDSGGGRVNVTVNANVTAVAVAGAGGRAGAGAVVYGGGGGGGGYYSAPGATGIIQGLNVEGTLKKKKVAYEAKRTRSRKVIIRAYCIDDRDTPHPASQVFAGEDVAEGYEGELYRCIAGTRMQWTLVEWSEKASTEGGKSIFCQKGEALYYEDGIGGLAGGPGAEGGDAVSGHGGRIACRPQRPARDCNERSLLRRFGAGVKVVTIFETETYTAYREETVREESSSTFNMSLDGGVGGTIY
jgi:hypothetical protein